MIDLKAIRAAAEAATPGPWEAVGPSFGAPLPKYLNEVGRINEDEMFEEVCVSPSPEDDACSADMIFIATANPAAILELLDRLEAAESQLAIYEKHGVTCQTFRHKLTGCAECNRDDFAAFHASERELMDTRDELLAALKLLCSRIEVDGATPLDSVEYYQARAAIAKAEGGAT